MPSADGVDPAWSDQQAADDEDDSPQDLVPEQGEDAGPHQNDRDNPENQLHAGRLPELPMRETSP